MFWGLIMEPGRCYTQKVKVSFHVSMAALDISNSNDDPAQVMCVFEGRNYLLCTLNKKDRVQCPLDLNFEAGTKVSFATNGKAHVHLTGYLNTLEEEYLDEEQGEEEEEAEDIPKKEKKRPKKEVNDAPPSKKQKTVKQSPNKVEEEEEDSSDSDFDVSKLIQGEIEEEEESDEEDEEEEEEDGGEEVEEEEDGASSLSDEELEEVEEETKVKPKLNGVAKTKALSPTKKKKEQKQEIVSEERPKKQEAKKSQAQKNKKTVLKGGVIAQDIKEGTGELVKDGKLLHVYYEGRLKDNNKMFDSTTKGPGFSFRIGKGEVIKGWDIGLVGMKVGGKRRIICPPKVAYGSDGSPPVIPPNSTLVFDVEIKKVS